MRLANGEPFPSVVMIDEQVFVFTEDELPIVINVTDEAAHRKAPVKDGVGVAAKAFTQCLAGLRIMNGAAMTFLRLGSNDGNAIYRARKVCIGTVEVDEAVQMMQRTGDLIGAVEQVSAGSGRQRHGGRATG